MNQIRTSVVGVQTIYYIMSDFVPDCAWPQQLKSILAQHIRLPASELEKLLLNRSSSRAGVEYNSMYYIMCHKILHYKRVSKCTKTKPTAS